MEEGERCLRQIFKTGIQLPEGIKYNYRDCYSCEPHPQNKECPNYVPVKLNLFGGKCAE